MPEAAGYAILKGAASARPEAPPPRSGAPPRAVQRRTAFSRSRDFDTVYRARLSVSTRYLVLYRFDREDDEDGDVRPGSRSPRRSTAVTRNRIKRRLRESWRAHRRRAARRTTSCLFGHPWERPRRAAAPSGCASVSRKSFARHAREVRRDRGVYAYRYTLGALVPATCKYHPSCSQHAIDALRQYGLVRGTILAGWRPLRCIP